MLYSDKEGYVGAQTWLYWFTTKSEEENALALLSSKVTFVRFMAFMATAILTYYSYYYYLFSDSILSQN